MAKCYAISLVAIATLLLALVYAYSAPAHVVGEAFIAEAVTSYKGVPSENPRCQGAIERRGRFFVRCNALIQLDPQTYKVTHTSVAVRVFQTRKDAEADLNSRWTLIKNIPVTGRLTLGAA